MSKFMQSGGNFSPVESSIMHDRLPTGVYSVAADPMGRYFFVPVPPFKLEKRYYGDIEARAKRIMTTFSARPANTGVLLTGQKGSGKTLLAKMLAVEVQQLDMPVIMVTQPHSGDGFNHLMRSVDQPHMLFIDEFEKIYTEEHQNALLSLLDGTFGAKRMTVVTLNEWTRLNRYLTNRPGRFFYRYDYEGLEDSFIADYCQENLNDKSRVDEVGRIANLFSDFNFDVLRALVEEMNRYDESAKDAARHLNVQPNFSSHTYEVKDAKIKPALRKRLVARYGDIAKKYTVCGDAIDINPFVDFGVPIHDEDDDQIDHAIIRTDRDMKKYTPSEIVFDGTDLSLRLVKQTRYTRDYYDLL